MTTIEDVIGKVHFGSVGKPLPDWRAETKPEPDDDGNDEDAPCPEDVKAVLGFDPDDETA